LVPVLGYTFYASADTAIWASRYGNLWDIFETTGMLFVLLLLPGLIGWRWHLAGGWIMMLESSVNLLMISVSVATSDPYAYFELDPSYVLRVILPMWVTVFVGAILHQTAWWMETRK